MDSAVPKRALFPALPSPTGVLLTSGRWSHNVYSIEERAMGLEELDAQDLAEEQEVVPFKYSITSYGAD